jgi:hypothetical protein
MKKMNVRVLKGAALLTLVTGLFAGVNISPAVGAGFVAAMLPAMGWAYAAVSGSGVIGFSPIDRHAFLRQLKAKAKLTMPATAATLEPVLLELEEGLKPENEKKNADYMRALMERVANNEAGAKAELAKLRITTVDNFIIAQTNPMAFFDTVNLADNEIPYIENTSKQEITISYLGQDGRARRSQPIAYQQSAMVELHVISTEEFEYQLRDIYKGEVKSAAMANIDMARDLELKISKLLWPFIQGAIGPFVTTGPRAGRTYFPHSIVNIKNLPTTNLLTAAGNTTTSLWRKECMDIVLKYAAAWGTQTLPGIVMKPTAIYIPSSEVMGFLDQVTLTSQPNTKVEEIFEYGYVITYGGATWNLIGDATLDPDLGLAYVKFNNPIGMFFRKPGMDQTFEDNTIDMQKQNKGSVSMNKVIGFGLPINYRLNIAAVRYHNDRT